MEKAMRKVAKEVRCQQCGQILQDQRQAGYRGPSHDKICGSDIATGKQDDGDCRQHGHTEREACRNRGSEEPVDQVNAKTFAKELLASDRRKESLEGPEHEPQNNKADCQLDKPRHNQADLAHRISVARLGGLPYISSPMRKTLAANQIAANTDPTPIRIDSQTCHHGGGAAEAILSSIANVLMGGMKLNATLVSESGFREIGIQRIHGIIRIRMSGAIRPCASRISLTAAPIAIINEPNTRYMITKKIRM